jgi:hypothetical protein
VTTANEHGEIIVHVAPNTAEFDEWVHSLRVLVSQIGFALDGYLAARPAQPVDNDA